MPAPGEEGTMTAIIDPQDEDALDYATLDALRGDDDGYDGPYDHICPLCGPGRASEYNRTRPTLRTWRLGPGAISYNCQRCKVHGSALYDPMQLSFEAQPKQPPPKKPCRAT
jgi:hypothetical protein